MSTPYLSDDEWICNACQRRVFLARVWDDKVVCAGCADGCRVPCECPGHVNDEKEE